MNKRNISVTLTNAMPMDAMKAILKRIDDLETQRFNGATVADITAGTAVVTGATPFKVYVFTFTSVMATGTYTAVFEEAAPNVETSTELNG